MKKMSCFCASNTSGDSVYSGYLRWRMGLPLPPIPKDEQSKVLMNTNKTILQDIDGVRNVNDFTIVEDENEDGDQTLRRFRRRKYKDSSRNETDKTSNNNTGGKHFRENPMYVSSTMSSSNSKSSKLESKLDCVVPSMLHHESFIHNPQQQPTNTELISSLLHNRFFDSMQEYTDPYVPSTYESHDSTNLQKATDHVVSSLSDHAKFQSFSDKLHFREPKLISPPPPPPHAISIPPHSKRPSTIFEEDSNIGEDSTLMTDVTTEGMEEGSVMKDNDLDNEEDEDNETLPIQDRNTLTLEVSDKQSVIHENDLDETVNSHPIPIFSLKRGGLNRILTAAEYDYAYNKNWCKGVQFNLSLNLSEERMNIQPQVLIPSRKNSDDKSLDISSSSSSQSFINNKENLLPLSGMSASPPLLWTGDTHTTPNNCILTDPDDNTVCGGVSSGTTDSTVTMNTTKALSLKLSSIEADALNDINEVAGDKRNDMATSMTKPSPPAPASPTKISRCSAMTTESEETNDSTSMKNESWDVIHGQFVKEITGTRFIDPSIINNNHPQSQTSPFSILPPPPPLPNTNQWIQPSHIVTPPTVASFLSHSNQSQTNTNASNSKITSSSKHSSQSSKHAAQSSKHSKHHHHQQHTKGQPKVGGMNTSASFSAATSPALSGSFSSSQRYIININPNVPLENQRWYHFYLTRSQAENLLQSYPDGSFLVRRSESNINDYSLSIKHKGQFLHMKITYGTGNHSNNSAGGFVLGEYSQPYNSIPHMLYHYCLTMVPVKGAEAACLKYAVTRD